MPRSWVGICTRTDGCIRPAGHKGACKVADMEEEEYEVEKVLDERAGKRGPEYLIKWVGWPMQDSTWEGASALADCKRILRDWEASRPQPSSAASCTSQPKQRRLDPQGGGSAEVVAALADHFGAGRLLW